MLELSTQGGTRQLHVESQVVMAVPLVRDPWWVQWGVSCYCGDTARQWAECQLRQQLEKSTHCPLGLIPVTVYLKVPVASQATPLGVGVVPLCALRIFNFPTIPSVVFGFH